MKLMIQKTIEVREFSRSPKGTLGVFIVPWGKLAVTEQMINSYFTRINGKVSFESVNKIDSKTGKVSQVIFATVKKRGDPIKKRGRKS